MELRPVILTGFEAFGAHEENISEQVVSTIEAMEIEGIQLDCHILSVDEVGSRTVAKLLPSVGDVCAVVQLGLHESANSIQVETIAHNALDMRTPDNSGRMVSKSRISTDGPDRIEGYALATASGEESPVAFEHSADAGRFVCNETYYRTLQAISNQSITDPLGRRMPAVFVHLPHENELLLQHQIDFVLWLIDRIVSRHILDVAAAVIRRADGTILCCRRAADQAHAGFWEFPGGKLLAGEEHEQALARELMEELGIEVVIGDPLIEIEHAYPDYDVRLRVLNCTACPDQPEPILVVHDRLCWVSIEELSNLDWLAADVQIVELIQSNHS